MQVGSDYSSRFFVTHILEQIVRSWEDVLEESDVIDMYKLPAARYIHHSVSTPSVIHSARQHRLEVKLSHSEAVISS